VEKNPKNSEEKDESLEEGGESMKTWLQENMRMLVSIVIVVAIAGGIYAYSKRTQPQIAQKESVETAEEAEGKISVIGGDTAKEEQAAEGAESETAAQAPQPAEEVPTAVPAEASKETDSSFVETAQKGDSTTKLARRALANYLEKNPDASLTAEHKIYIEDYLRRQVKDGKLKVGESREFTKGNIAQAVEKSKTLTEGQLKNLEKYAQRVPELM
jgi:predicted negative regulator of RcsB-dependent stress response